MVDLACMRDAMNRLGSDSNKINPLVIHPSVISCICFNLVGKHNTEFSQQAFNHVLFRLV